MRVQKPEEVGLYWSVRAGKRRLVTVTCSPDQRIRQAAPAAPGSERVLRETLEEGTAR